MIHVYISLLWIHLRCTESKWVTDSPEQALRNFKTHLLLCGLSEDHVERMFLVAGLSKNSGSNLCDFTLSSQQECEVVRALASFHHRNKREENLMDRWILSIIRHLRPRVWNWIWLVGRISATRKQGMNMPDYLWASLHYEVQTFGLFVIKHAKELHLDLSLISAENFNYMSEIILSHDHISVIST